MSARHDRTGLILECILQGVDAADTIIEGSPILRTAQYIVEQPDRGSEIAAFIAGLAYSAAELLADFQIPRLAVETHIRELLLLNETAGILEDAEDAEVPSDGE
jgi:hypothetical protein